MSKEDLNGEAMMPLQADLENGRLETEDIIVEAIGGGCQGPCFIHTLKQNVLPKDFHHEVRAMKDLADYLEQTTPLLDVHEQSPQDIFRAMLDHSLPKKVAAAASAEAFEVLFTPNPLQHMTSVIESSVETDTGVDVDQSWLGVMCSVPSVKRRHVCIARLMHPVNFGRSHNEVQFVILVVVPTIEKGTKNELETARTFATLFADTEFRTSLLTVKHPSEVNNMIWKYAETLSQTHEKQTKAREAKEAEARGGSSTDMRKCQLFVGLREDFKRRIKVYLDDYKDGVTGSKTIQKTASTTLFLFFACLLPCIALGVLNSNNTHGKLDVKKVIFSQTIGGLFFVILGGQPLVILLTTAPLALYTKVIYTICEEWGIDFFAMYAAVGLWNSFFVLVYSFTGASRLMKWSTRSTEEIFALFISVAFTVDTFKDVAKDFQKHYTICGVNTTSLLNESILEPTTMSPEVTPNNSTEYVPDVSVCAPETSILFLFLVLSTVWLGITLFRFTKTPYLNHSKREVFADYALPIAVLVMSFIGSYAFRSIPLTPFSYNDGTVFNLAPLEKLSWGGVLGSMGLGFCLSLLFFMDQNISGAMVNTPDNRLTKGPAYHWDLMIVALLNGFLTLFCLPMMHGALPHSPLHARALADTEDRVEQGHVYQRVVVARETRLTGIFCHILIGLSIFLLPYPLAHIPRPVLDGLFLYLAITALDNNQMFERIMLLFTEQTAYPPNHYIRRVPQRQIHYFTITQVIQLGVMCAFGFSPLPYLKMVFPVLLLVMLPVRHGLVPKLIPRRYLQAIDGH